MLSILHNSKENFVETYRSGRNETDSKSVEPFWFRGFESHRLRLKSPVITGLFLLHNVIMTNLENGNKV